MAGWTAGWTAADGRSRSARGRHKFKERRGEDTQRTPKKKGIVKLTCSWLTGGCGTFLCSFVPSALARIIQPDIHIRKFPVAALQRCGVAAQLPSHWKRWK